MARSKSKDSRPRYYCQDCNHQNDRLPTEGNPNCATCGEDMNVFEKGGWEPIPTSTVQQFTMEFFPWVFYGKIVLPEKEGYRAAELIAVTEDGKDGVKVAWLKLE